MIETQIFRQFDAANVHRDHTLHFCISVSFPCCIMDEESTIHSFFQSFPAISMSLLFACFGNFVWLFTNKEANGWTSSKTCTQQNKIIRDVTSWDPTREKKVCKLFDSKSLQAFLTRVGSNYLKDKIPDELRNILEKDNFRIFNFWRNCKKYPSCYTAKLIYLEKAVTTCNISKLA